MSSPLLVKILRNGKEFGTFEAKDIIHLTGGDHYLVNHLKPFEDFYMHEGMTEWAPLLKLQASEARRQLAERAEQLKQEEAIQAEQLAQEKALKDEQLAQEKAKAAEQGHAKAQFNLGVCYDNDLGVAKDEIEAYAYYNLAGITNEVARENLAILEKKMSRDEIASGQQRTKQLQKEIEAKRAGK